MKLWIIIGSLLAALSVLVGAFGAHGLKSRVSTADLEIFENVKVENSDKFLFEDTSSIDNENNLDLSKKRKVEYLSVKSSENNHGYLISIEPLIL